MIAERPGETSSPPAHLASAETRVLILARVGRDGMLAERLLAESGIDAQLCVSASDLVEAVEAGAGLLLLTTEALDEVSVQRIARAIDRQPAWSDIPVVLLSGEADQAEVDVLLGPLGNVTVLQRPVRLPSLLATVRSGLRARKRQYQVRDLLAQAERARADAEMQQAHIEALNTRLQRAMTETHHRVKNNLQIIAAMVDMRVLDGTPTIPAEEFKRLGNHVRMLASVHDLLTQQAKEDGQANHISAKAVMGKLLPLMQQTAGHRRIDFQADDCPFSARQGTSFALVVNELVSNAIKYGKNAIQVSLQVQDSTATLEVCDDGPGFPEGFNALEAANTGLELVEHLSTWDLGGRTRYANRPEGGGCVVLTIPLIQASRTT
jgi:two-component sensor histidine kinase